MFAVDVDVHLYLMIRVVGHLKPEQN